MLLCVRVNAQRKCDSLRHPLPQSVLHARKTRRTADANGFRAASWSQARPTGFGPKICPAPERIRWLEMCSLLGRCFFTRMMLSCFTERRHFHRPFIYNLAQMRLLGLNCSRRMLHDDPSLFCGGAGALIDGLTRVSPPSSKARAACDRKLPNKNRHCDADDLALKPPQTWRWGWWQEEVRRRTAVCCECTSVGGVC